MTHRQTFMQRIFGAATLAAVMMLFLVISNVHQPTELFGFHCTVHDYVTKALGGECDSHTQGLFSAMDSMALTTFFLVVILFSVIVRAFIIILPRVCAQALAPRGPRDKLHKFYSRGIAQSRRFV